jgi:methionine-S-sulfoxide reductase
VNRFKVAAVFLAALWLAPTAAQEAPAGTETAVFAGGCFWCTESDFEKVPGVVSAVSGYIGGSDTDPTYAEVSAGGTGHAEAVEVRFDPTRVGYGELLDVFWRSIDPLDAGGQFCDRGDPYRSAVFFKGEEQRRLAEASKGELERSGRFDRPIATELAAAGTFHPAEDYHQDYYKTNALKYKFYRWNCGRDQRLTELWGPVS